MAEWTSKTLKSLQKTANIAEHEIEIFKFPEICLRDFKAFECTTKERKVLELKN